LEHELETAVSPPVATPAAAATSAPLTPLLGALSPARVIALQRTVGNRAVSALLQRDDTQKTPEGDIVRWVHYALVNAEELGLTKANIDQQAKADNPEIKRFVGTEGKFGETVGLTNDWAVRIIKHVGNYGEIFERNIGESSPLKIKRGINALWTQGGLMYAPPIR